MENLINRIINNDSKAWEDFVQKFQRVVIGTISKSKQKLNKDDKEEVIQRVFFKLIDNNFYYLKNIILKTEAVIATYIYKITKSIIVDYLKEESRYINFNYNPQDIDNGQSLVELILDKKSFFEYDNFDVDQNMICETIFERFMKLPLAFREIIFLNLKGYKYREIAEILKMNEKTVSTNIIRAKQILKKDKILKDIFS